VVFWLGYTRAVAQEQALAKESAAIDQRRSDLLNERTALETERSLLQEQRVAFEKERASRAEQGRTIRAVIDQNGQAQLKSFGLWTNYVAPTLVSPLGTAPTFTGSILPDLPERHTDAPPNVKLADYVNRLWKLDFHDCPDDFKQAYLRHIQAWDRKLAFYSRSTGNRDLMALVSLASFAAGFPKLGLAGADGVLKDNQAAASKGGTVEDEIRESWYQVQRVAWKYDLGIPGRGP
jgi:hypothetical protein